MLKIAKSDIVDFFETQKRALELAAKPVFAGRGDADLVISKVVDLLEKLNAAKRQIRDRRVLIRLDMIAKHLIALNTGLAKTKHNYYL